MTKIYTKTGDAGDTGMLGGGRVPKDSGRIEAYGNVDELNSAIGAALAHEPVEFQRELLERIQADLFSIGAVLAAPDPEKVHRALEKTDLGDDVIAGMEQAIDRADELIAPLDSFVLPGGTVKAAQLHLARTVCRRAEREVVRLGHTANVPAVVLRYLNRLSDLLFTLARLANHEAGHPDKKW